MSEPAPEERVNPLYLSNRIRAIERAALAATGEGILMARAATAVADACTMLLRDLPPRTPVLALVGPGNNGGDALLAVSLLCDRGHDGRALALSTTPPTAPDAARVWQDWLHAGRPLSQVADLDEQLDARPLVIDGLFGIGLVRPLPPEAASVASRVAAAGLTVVAVDVPSGLDADSGSIRRDEAAEPAAMRATVTVTMIADKPGLHTGAGAGLAGRVMVAPLGIDEAGSAAVAADGWLLDASAFVGLPRPRRRDSHKGSFGDVLILGGAAGMRGAALLAALGAQAVGAGRIFVGRPGVDPKDVGLDPLHPELMTRQIADAAPAASVCASAAAIDALGPAAALAVGCGLGTGPAAHRLVSAALDHPATLVIDADALNVLSGDDALRGRLAGRPTGPGGMPRSILTPHPLEAARLLGASTAEVQRDRIAAACRIAASTGAIVVLKGAGTVVAAPDGTWTINRSGGPILSVAGTGDVLAGAIAGLIATGLDAPTAARFGTWLHGTAGDALALQPRYQAGVGMPASELAESLRDRINRFAVGRC